MGVVFNTVAYRIVLDSEAKVVSYQAENHYTYEPENENDTAGRFFSPKIVFDDITEEEFSQAMEASGEGLTDALQAAHAQITEERKAHAAEVAGLQQALAERTVQYQQASAAATQAAQTLAQIRGVVN